MKLLGAGDRLGMCLPLGSMGEFPWVWPKCQRLISLGPSCVVVGPTWDNHSMYGLTINV